MIKIRLVAVGKIKEKYYSEAIAEYSKRLSRFCDFEIVEVKEENYEKFSRGDVPKILAVEGERIKKAIRGYAITLAIEGAKVSSESFADKIEKLVSGGNGEITFIIGGSYGVSPEIKQGTEKLSFSVTQDIRVTMLQEF